MPTALRPEGDGRAPAWRALPWLAATAVLAGLTMVTFSDAAWAQARSVFPWMLRPNFHDWQVVRLGMNVRAAGLDPLADMSNPYNYPRALLLGADLGLQYLPAALVGLTAAAAALGALAFLLARAGRLAAATGALLMLSSPVLLLLERGNVDAWVVVLLVAGLFALTRAQAPGWQAAGVAAVLLASVLKLYPALVLVGGIVAWRDARRRWLLVTLALFVVAFFANRDEAGLIFAKTGRGLEPGYGWAMAASRHYLDAAAKPGAVAPDPEIRSRVMHASLALFAALLLAATVAGWRLRRRLAEVELEPLSRACFWSGALIYAGTFALGANWSYRLVFLLLCLPGLGAAIRTGTLRGWSWLVLLALGVTLLAPFHLSPAWFYGSQVVEWMLAGMLCSGAVALLFPPASASARA